MLLKTKSKTHTFQKKINNQLWSKDLGYDFIKSLKSTVWHMLRREGNLRKPLIIPCYVAKD